MNAREKKDKLQLKKDREERKEPRRGEGNSYVNIIKQHLSNFAFESFIVCLKSHASLNPF